ncbi:zinc finger CCCH domain-containing protein 18-like [Pollicipes pollicipes]|uniref:zinc finger CCCH domain-containing protein 18-like n=1 Tax=Pollicipes pollicipes TaxID=41117 RepID=UPI0018853C4B|nr:zinc finger CCCH domain-containing protein 18-like [Pollicipes pollicipes]
MSAMNETTFTVQTGGDNDAMQVPDGIETVVVNDNAERVIVPAGVEVIRLQMPKGGGGGQRSRSRSRSRSPDWSTRASSGRSESPSSYGDMIDELVRAKRSTVSEAVQASPAAVSEAVQTPRAPAKVEKSLSLPSVPATPPGSRTEGTDVPDFRPAARPPPLAAPERDAFDDRTLEVGRKRDIFDDRTLEVDKKRVIGQQPAGIA